MTAQLSGRRNKLGLALAGGGFRASLFHLGVLRRMAELDLMRYVEAMSTVSGGSIIGALYALLLKKYLEKPENKGELSRAQYVQIMDELQDALVRGIQKNLRTLLFLNPLGILRVLTTPRSLGKRMAVFLIMSAGSRCWTRSVIISSQVIPVDSLEPGRGYLPGASA